MPAANSDNGADAHLTLDRLRALVGSGRIDTVLLAVPDLQGRLKGKRYNARHFCERVAHQGAEMCAYVLATDVDMRPLDGFTLASWETGYQDIVVTPAISTLRLVPWMPGTALVLGDVADRHGEPIEVAPRQMLRRQLTHLAAHGLHVKTGLETEFVLYQGTGDQNMTPLTAENLDFALDHTPVALPFFRRLEAGLAGAGLPVEAVKTEGAGGQVEVTFPYGEPLAACDGHLVFKHAARTLATRMGLTPTFMAAPQTGIGSGLHLHLSLWKNNTSVLTDPDGALSTLAEHAVAGLLDALPQLGPLYAPNINSYKRYVPSSFAPTAFTWGYDNRTCAIRVVGHGENLHLEVRVPGADANPYLATAAVVAAIAYGLDRTPPLPSEQSGNAYRDMTAPPLAHTLEEALTWFSESTIAEARFGREVVQHYTRLAQVELDHQRALVPDTERARWLLHA
ncbi:glutamine synthetase family protein [Streptomyces sp. YGL11-2]|uniref:glutamine synthetase family protein n=1 Tax=Streptomyces sp. YGL11-2 TaxID=3414028 RepID=UPI003CF8D467